MDTGVGSCVGPIFPDMSYEYIPIPDLITSEQSTYNNYLGKKGIPLSNFIPNKLSDQKIHFDPDFRDDINVYGDSTTHQKYLRKLQKKDIVLFYAGLTPWENERKQGKSKGIDLYLIGFLEVEKVIKVNIININKIRNNAHNKRFEYIKYLHEDIWQEYGVSYSKIIYNINNKNYFDINLIKNSILKYKKGKKINYSNIKNFDRDFEKILIKETWKKYIKNSNQEEVIETYMYLLDKFSKFTLVYGTNNSRLFNRAVKISKRSKNKSGSTENIVSKKWSKMLGIPMGLSIQRKNPRWIPNKKYNLNGKIDKILQIIQNT